MENNTLQHHGILGQKWGVRRYQNKDGTLTPAGKKRAAELDAKRAKLDRKYSKLYKIKSDSQPTQTKQKEPKRVNIKDLSDDELKRLVTRLQNEQKLKEYISPKKEKTIGRKFLDSFKDKAINEISDMAAKRGRLYLEKKIFKP